MCFYKVHVILKAVFASLGTIHEEKASLLVKFISFWLLGRSDVSQQEMGGRGKQNYVILASVSYSHCDWLFFERAFLSLLENRGLVRILATTSV